MTTNTKRIARLTNTTTANVNATARDLAIPMTYNSTNRYWEMDSREADLLISMLSENACICPAGQFDFSCTAH